MCGECLFYKNPMSVYQSDYCSANRLIRMQSVMATFDNGSQKQSSAANKGHRHDHQRDHQPIQDVPVKPVRENKGPCICVVKGEKPQKQQIELSSDRKNIGTPNDRLIVNIQMCDKLKIVNEVDKCMLISKQGESTSLNTIVE